MSGWATRIHEEEEKKRQHAETHHYVEPEPAIHQQQPTHYLDPEHAHHLGGKKSSFVVETPGLPVHVGMFSLSEIGAYMFMYVTVLFFLHW